MARKIEKSNVREIFELSPIQKGMLFYYLRETGQNLYNVQLSFFIDGLFDPAVFQQAVDLVRKQHEVLHSVFRWDNVNKPLQIILKECPVDIVYRDISGQEEGMIADLVRQYSAEDWDQRFDLEKFPFRIRIIRTGARSLVLNISYHHILYDGWSNGILLKDLFYCYNRLAEGAAPEWGWRPRYKEIFLSLRQKEDKNSSGHFWRKYLKDYKPAALFTGGRAESIGKAGIRHRIFSAAEADLDSFASVHKVTKASVVYAAYAILLHWHLGAKDIVFGTTVAGRDGSIPGMDQTIGNFINAIPLRVRDLEERTLLEIVSGVNGDLIDRNAYGNTSYPEIKIILGLGPADSLYDSEVAIENYPLDTDAITRNKDFTVTLREVSENTSTPLVVTVFLRDGLTVDLAYREQFIGSGYIHRLGNDLISIVRQILADSSVTAGSVVSTAGEEGTVMDWIEGQVMATPKQIALQSAGRTISYRELKGIYDKIGSWLCHGAGVGAGELVGVMLSREDYLVPVLLGIWRAGAAYVPIDPSYPAERIKWIIEDAGIKVLVTRGGFPGGAVGDGYSVLDLETSLTAIMEGNVELPEEKTGQGSLAYVLYTSGSTGRPKGVMIEHGSLGNYIRWASEQYVRGEKATFALYSSISFDLTVTSIFTPLVTGNKIVVFGEDKRGLIIDAVIDHGDIDIIKLTPSHLKIIRDMEGTGWPCGRKLKLIVGGEDLPTHLARDIQEKFGGKAEIYNEYGPTEATVGCMIYRFSGNEATASVPIGIPASNTRIYLLDGELNAVPPGVEGELYIGGRGLARGYLNNEALTRQRFIDDPMRVGEKMYKTGDLAVIDPVAGLLFRGRVDDQVKVRGFRIEPGEVEARLCAHEQIRDAAVVTRAVDGNMDLVAYYVAETEIEEAGLKAFLSLVLPEYMLPACFMRLKEMPLTVNGKLDKRALPESRPNVPPAGEFLAVSGEMEERIGKLWTEVLGKEGVSANRNFFEAGGDSMKLLSLGGKINRAFKTRISINDLFSHPTISSFAAFMVSRQTQDGDKKEAARSAPVERIEKTEIKDTDIAIIGMAGRFPGAANVDEFWENLRSGKESITRKESTNPAIVNAKGCLENDDVFDAAFFDYIPSEAASMDPQIRVFHECSWEALENAGYDPNSYAGDIGLYAGASPNPFYNPSVRKNYDEDFFEKWAALSYADKDFLCTRVSYKLNLKGPSVTIATACSTSLVAVDTACRELLAGRCDMALAGGISVTHHDNEGYVYHKGMILSPDGRCRAFDEESAGTVGGNGVGVVVLKKLSDALRDGDTVLAVIKGSAINNDGSRKVGFTAPGVDGQAAVVRKAIAAAGIAPESISYVEAHGTGTALGDPVEIAGLTKAFGTEKRQFCAIGSVKTNIGHLDAAAGIAGLIKAVLSLRNGLIPPNVHFKHPNPHLDIGNTPFFVNSELRVWERTQHPRRAGVSAFGIGGTNAHVILEEAPGRKPSGSSRDYAVVVVSGRTPGALRGNIARLVNCLKASPEYSFSDIAYTLQIGRSAFPYRKMIVCRDREEAIELLSQAGSQKEGLAAAPPKATVAFLFSGQGSQYPGMCAGLYAKERSFQETVDRCFGILKTINGPDLRPVIFPAAGEEGAGDLDRTELTQPALFIVEYALAQWLIARGVRPSVMIGHSIGEYAAACVSGVFSLEDALMLVVERGRIMQQAPRGAMLSIYIPPEQLLPYLADKGSVSLAAVNSSAACVVSGTEASIGAFREKMTAAGYACKLVRTSHGFHSYMMDAILPRFAAVVGKVKINPRTIPFISNITGKEITDQELARPGYWVDHLRGEVRFSQGVETVLKNEHVVFIEAGPGNALASFVRSNVHMGPGHKVIGLVRHPRQQADDVRTLYKGLGDCWVNGVAIDWRAFYDGEQRTRVPLPAYAFEGVRFPLPLRDGGVGTGGSGADAGELHGASRRNAAVAEWFYVPAWRNVPILPVVTPLGNGGCCVILGENEEIGQLLAQRFMRDNTRAISVSAEEEPGEIFERLLQEGTRPGHIIYSTIPTGSAAQPDGSADFKGLLRMVRAAHVTGCLAGAHITLLTANLYNVSGVEKVDIGPAALTGLLKVIPQEFPQVTVGHIDVSPEASGRPAVVDALYEELGRRKGGNTVALRNGRRWEPGYERIVFSGTERPGSFRQGGVYLITGGMGELGCVLSAYLMRVYEAKLILLGRSAEPKPERMERLPKDNGKALYLSCDTSREEELYRAIETGESRLGRINGIIHAAGVVKGDSIEVISRLEAKACEAQFDSKVKTLENLEKVLRGRQLDFCIATSSISAVLGGMRLGAYAAANAAMDHYITAMGDSGLLKKWISVNLDGLAFDDPHGQGIRTAELHQVFERLPLLADWPQAIVSVADLEQRLNKWVGKKEQAVAGTADGMHEQTPETGIADAASIEDLLLSLWRDYFGIKTIEPTDDFFELGGDSLKVLTITGRIHKALGIEVSMAEFFQYPSVRALSDHLKEAGIGRIGNGRAQAPAQRGTPGIPPAETKEYYALSPVQRRLYFLYEYDKTSIAYNMPLLLDLAGELDQERLKAAFIALIQRHEILRSRFVVVDGAPCQQVQERFEFDVESLPPGGTTAALVAEFVRPFDLARGPLIRVGLAVSAPGEYRLLVDLHHIVTDGVSKGILIKDFMVLYGGGEPEGLILQYKDFAEWNQSKEQQEKIVRQRDFWIKEFADETPVLELPVDFSRPAIKRYEGATVRFEAGAAESMALKSLGEQEGATPFMVILAVFTVLLSKLGRQEVIVTGTPVAGRQHPDLEAMFGMFVNTLPLRNVPAGHLSFRAYLQAVKARTIACLDNQDYPYEELIDALQVERDTSRNPLFEVMFAWQNFAATELELSGLTLRGKEEAGAVAKFDLTLYAFEKEDKIVFDLEYSTALFKKETVERFAGYFREIVSAVCADADTRLADIGIMGEGERAQLLHAFNDTRCAVDESQTIPAVFARVALERGDAAAVAGGGYLLTYKELDERSSRLAMRLRELGVKAGDVVGIMARRSPELIVSMLGVLKAGCAYVPIDPDYPLDRIRYIVADSRLMVLLSEPSCAAVYGQLPEGMLTVDITAALPSPESMDVLPAGGVSSDLAYLIYTSGSTGNPKGVMIEHRNVINFIAGITSRIPFTKEDTMLCLTTMSFDIFVLETLLPLLTGLKVVLADEVGQKDIYALAGLIREEKVDLMQITPSHLKLVLHDEEGRAVLKRLKVLMVGGEALPAELLAQLRNDYGGRLYNMYGPTETTVWSTVRDLTEASSIDIGSPIANTIVRILDSHQRLQPVGIAGELYIGGRGVGRGYWGREELTAERFVPDPVGEEGRFYRTGDLARWLDDGNIEYLGRVDHQVKLRGFRIELGEIEAQLAAHEEVREAVVVLKERQGEKYLAAYYVVSGDVATVSVGDVTEAILRGFLSARLPGYMVPAQFIRLERLPLTPNGKLDRRALPEPAGMGGGGCVAPGTVEERVLAKVWSKVLGVEEIGVTDNFFSAGGDSIKSIRISSEMRSSGYVLSVKDIFTYPTIRQLAGMLAGGSIRDKEGVGEAEIVPVLPPEQLEELAKRYAPEAIYRLSPMQEGMLFHSVFDAEPGSDVYFEQMTCRMRGGWDVGMVQRSLDELIARHAVLRTMFLYSGYEHPLQLVLKERRVEFLCVDIREECRHRPEDAVIGTYLEKDRARGFNLATDVLVRVTMLQVCPDEFVLIWSHPHVIMDGWSLEILLKEFREVYSCNVAGLNCPLEQVRPYSSYIHWLEKKDKGDTARYWRDYLASYDSPATLPGKPRSLAGEPGHKGVQTLRIDRERTQALQRVSAANGVTMNTLLQTAWAIVLSRYNNTNDVVFGSVVSGRPGELEGIEGMVGLFINTIPVRVRYEADQSVADLLRRVQAEALEATPHQYHALAEIQQQSELGRGLLDHVMVFLNYPIGEKIGNASAGSGPSKDCTLTDVCLYNRTNYDLLLLVMPDEELSIRLEYDCHVFDPELMQSAARHYDNVLKQMAAACHTPVADILITGQEEREQLINRWNDTGVAYPAGKTITQLIEEQTLLSPDNVALVFPDGEVTYGELNASAGKIAAYLRSVKGVKPGDLVGVRLGRDRYLVPALLGILKAGAAYIPIDTDYPAERVNAIAGDARWKVLVTASVYANNAGRIDEDALLLDKVAAEIEACEDLNPEPAVDSSHLAYVIYTSGSTGSPKGVMIEHRSLVNYITWAASTYIRGERSTFALYSSIAFDLTVTSIFAPLVTGNKIVVYDENDAGLMIGQIIRDERIDVIKLTPSHLKMVRDGGFAAGNSPGRIKKLIVGGEDLETGLAKDIHELMEGNVEIYNEYGPTEATVGCMIHRYDPAEAHSSVPIGLPIQNTGIYILDRHLEPVPVGVTGELYIAGSGVARGYLAKPEVTAQKFTDDPFVKGRRMYSTGDLAVRQRKGELIYKGRADDQVKINGFRIEPGEIEAHLLRHAQIREAKVLVREKAGDRTLVAYYVSEREIDPRSLKEFLSQTLQGYMVPGRFIHLASLPVTPNGKLDKKALPDPGIYPGERYVAPASPVERKLAEIWSEILKIEKEAISADASFFDLGGHSLKARLVVNRIFKELDVFVPMKDLFRKDTIGLLSAYIENEKWLKTETAGRLAQGDEFILE